MRTDVGRKVSIIIALAISLLSFGDKPAAAAPDGGGWWRQFEVGLWPEVTLVGLSGGARAELAWRPGAPGTASRIRLAPGFLTGPEFNYFPIALGYRAVFRSTAVVRPLLGTGFEYQHRWVSDAPAARQIAWYGEVGLMVAPRPDVALGLVTAVDWTFVGGGGPGLVIRAGVTWTPGARAVEPRFARAPLSQPR